MTTRGLVVALATVACVDTGLLPIVRVRVEGVATAARDLATEVDTFYEVGADGGEVSRGIAWDGSDPFAFHVRLPRGTVRRVRAEIAAWFDCTGVPRRVVVARGEAAFEGVVPTDLEVRVVVHTIDSGPVCR